MRIPEPLWSAGDSLPSGWQTPTRFVITTLITFILDYHYSDTVGFDLVNPYVTKILLAVEPGDSISHVARKTGVSYGWTHRWIERLEASGVIERDEGIYVVDDELQSAFIRAAQLAVPRDLGLEDAYLLPNFAGMDYRYTKTDAVYHWTKGGYQIGRSRDDYPIFIDVLAPDVSDWKAFLLGFGVAVRVRERDPEQTGIHFVLFPQEQISSEWVDHAAVVPLEETVAWAQQYPANFQPALEMLAEMYDLDLDVTYREREVL